MKVIFHGSVREYTGGTKNFEAEAPLNLRTLIAVLGEQFGGQFKDFLLGDNTCFFLVNGTGIMTTGGLNTTLKPVDIVDVLPFVDAG